MAEVLMPQLGETVTEGTITKWFKNVGEAVAVDEVIFEVSTDKVDSEVTSPAAGVLTSIVHGEGATVAVGAVLATIGDVGATPAAAEAAPAPEDALAPEAAPAPEVPAPEVEATAVLAPAVDVVPVTVIDTVPPAPVVDAVGAPAAPVVEAVRVDAAVSSAPVIEAVPVPAAGAIDRPAIDTTGLVLSPVVRKLIADNSIDPASITGTGVGGRITREDVLDAIDARVAAEDSAAAATVPIASPVAAPAPVAESVVAAAEPVVSATPAPEPPPPAPAPVAPAPAPAPAPAVVSATPVVTSVAAVPAVQAGGRDKVVAFSNVRRRTGDHMVMSLATSPHAFIAVEADYSGVDKVRAARKESFKADEGFSLTYMPFIARAVLEAMRKFPQVNASVAGDSLVVHDSVHLGIAVDLDFQGLMVPVVRDADAKRMRTIARDISDLASRARTKKLTPDDISGGTFTLSNAGAFGIDLMQSIINQPQVAILSITSVKKKPVVIETPEGDLIGTRPLGHLGLSWDHRAFDGAYAASFLGEIRAQLEQRDWASEL